MHHFAVAAGRSGVLEEIGRHLQTRAMARDEAPGRVVAGEIELLALERAAIRRLTR